MSQKLSSTPLPLMISILEYCHTVCCGGGGGEAEAEMP